MTFSELIVLLPCHSLEDFPIHHQGDEAEGLLAAWSALWHPALLASAEDVPVWFRADGPPDDLSNRLIIVPEASESLLLSGWTTRAKDEGALVLRKIQRRDEMVAAALAGFEKPEDWPAFETFDAGMVRDFFALGTAYLLVELLTRQMRYMSNLDEVQLKRESIDAAKAWVAGDEETTRQHLKNAFEVITEARERFYPVSCYLVDLTLVASTTLGPALRADLGSETPTSLLVSGGVVEEMATREPETLKALKLALDHKRVSIVGGEFEENSLPLEPREEVLANFRSGIDAYERYLGQRPIVFGRRRFGLSPILPSLLTKLGFEAALHFTLDDGQFPHGSQAKTRWEGMDSSAIDALCRVPRDATAHETMLNFPSAMGESMDGDHVATVVFAHWPGQFTPFYDDLRRMSEYGSPLGKFVTLDEYFTTTDSPGELTQFKPDKYRSPYLHQAIVKQQADPLSQLASQFERSHARTASEALATMADLATGTGANGDAADTSVSAERLAKIVRHGGQARGCFIANGQSFARHALVDISRLAHLPATEGPVVAVQESDGKKWAVVEVPGCGFAWVAPAGKRGENIDEAQKPMAEGNVLRNELFEVTIHPSTGGIRSIHAASARGNRLSQQLAFRLPPTRQASGTLWRDPDEDAVYSVMCLDTMEVASPGPAFGEVVSRGRLMSPEGKRLAGFVQTLRVVRGSHRLEIDVELDIAETPRADPWNSYYAARFAWSDETAELWRSVSSTTQPTKVRRVEAPEFFDIRSDRSSTTLLFGGLAYHRRTSERMLDTLLVARGETRHKLRLAVCIDSPRPAHEAADVAADTVVIDDIALPSAQSGSGWLFHLDARNVLATHWHPVLDGTTQGFRARLLETTGRSGRVNLRTFKSPQQARQINFQGASLIELPIEGDSVGIDMAAYEWIEIEVLF